MSASKDGVVNQLSTDDVVEKSSDSKGQKELSFGRGTSIDQLLTQHKEVLEQMGYYRSEKQVDVYGAKVVLPTVTGDFETRFETHSITFVFKAQSNKSASNTTSDPKSNAVNAASPPGGQPFF